MTRTDKTLPFLCLKPWAEQQLGHPLHSHPLSREHDGAVSTAAAIITDIPWINAEYYPNPWGLAWQQHLTAEVALGWGHLQLKLFFKNISKKPEAHLKSVNKGERWFHLLSSQSIAFFPTVGNATWNMFRQASIYTVTRSCKTNHTSSGCQQKATPEKTQNICLPSKEKSAFSQLQRIENKFYHQTWSCAKSEAARRKLWHEKSFGELWVTGKPLSWDCFGAGGKGRWQEIVKNPLYSGKCVFPSAFCGVPSKISQCTGSHTLLGRAPAKAAASTPTSHSTLKAPCASPLGVSSPEITWSDVNAAFCLLTLAGNT